MGLAVRDVVSSRGLRPWLHHVAATRLIQLAHLSLALTLQGNITRVRGLDRLLPAGSAKPPKASRD